MYKIAIIGAGNVGKVLGSALKLKGYPIVAAFSRTEKSREVAAEIFQCPVYSEPEEATPEADIVLLTTPDRVIEEVCASIASKKGFRKGQVVLHTSGVHSSLILSPARRAGARILSFHPLQTFPELKVGLSSLAGTFFTVEGDQEAFPLAAELVEAFKGQMLTIPTDMKPLYHAAACVACNYLVTLMDMALQMYQLMDISAEKAFQSLSPLIYATLNNVKALNTEKALTGPISRGDVSTVNSHLEALKKLSPYLIPLYKQLGIYTADLAVRKGTINKEQAGQLKILLQGGNKNDS